MSDTVISGVTEGVYATAYAGAARIILTRSTIERATYAIDSEAEPGATALISVNASTIAQSNYGWYILGAGASVQSLGNNQWVANAGNLGVLTPVAPQ